jgi:hypothetical protein
LFGLVWKQVCLYKQYRVSEMTHKYSAKIFVYDTFLVLLQTFCSFVSLNKLIPLLFMFIFMI